jgi:Cdc6-like AAA superfamily ATPase
VYANEVYAQYKTICETSDTTPLSKVRVSSFFAELDMLGLSSARKFYKGRYGRIRLVASNISKEKVHGLLDDAFSGAFRAYHLGL